MQANRSRSSCAQARAPAVCTRSWPAFAGSRRSSRSAGAKSWPTSASISMTRKRSAPRSPATVRTPPSAIWTARACCSDCARSRARCAGGGETIEQLLAIGPRQRRNIEALLTLPEVCQRALEDDDQRFTATHALVLRAAQRRGESVHFAEWIGRIRREELSVRGLQLALARAARRERQAEPPEPTLFNLVGTDLGRGRARLLAIAIDRGQLSASAADALAADATALLSLLRRDATDATQAQGSRGGQRHEDT